jgi:hypothetical protein
METGGVKRPEPRSGTRPRRPSQPAPRCGQDLEAVVEARRHGMGVGQAEPASRDINLDPLVSGSEPVLGDHPLMDHADQQLGLPSQPRRSDDYTDQLAPTAASLGGCRWRARRLRPEVALDGAPVIAGLPGDLRSGGPSLGQRLEGTGGSSIAPSRGS